MVGDLYVLPMGQVGMGDIAHVGGKNASLGEMICHLAAMGIAVPEGLVVTAKSYVAFLQHNHLTDKIAAELERLDPHDVKMLQETGQRIRSWIHQGEFPEVVIAAIEEAYTTLCASITGSFSFAVRSSATAEDLPTASFAGQQESFLNVEGFTNIMEAIKRVYASLFNDRAIDYRHHHGFDHGDVAISVAIQRMVRSDLAASGVIFTLDTETGFNEVVLVTSAYGLGEAVVQGMINPDEFYVSKQALRGHKKAIIRRSLGSKQQKMVYASKNTNQTIIMQDVSSIAQHAYSISDEEVSQLASMALRIEEHYGCPMDIEWGKDGQDGKLYILQARPETVASQIKSQHQLVTYRLDADAPVLLTGKSVGKKIGTGTVRVVKDVNAMGELQPGEVLVADMTDPDWEPVMKLASAIVTNRGGRTCHAAIIARELGIPAVVGCGNATDVLRTGQEVTVSCVDGDVGKVYAGVLPFHCEQKDIEKLPELPVKIMMNIASPEKAFGYQFLPNSGVGLARLEFIINNMIGIHPAAALDYQELNEDLQSKICHKTRGFACPVEYYVTTLSEGVACIAAAFFPKPVIVRLSDFKTNEYAHLIGGKQYEPCEENPMLGFRGAGRYLSRKFARCFDLECQAILRVREDMGFDNLQIMVPFVRTLAEAKAIDGLLRSKGLERGKHGLRVMMMCEIPSNALLAESFLQYFDGFSIGSNDLTQLTLGIDRDSELVAQHFDERDPAIKCLLRQVITTCKKLNKYVGICGQGPSDFPDFAKWLLEQGIESMSLNPDTVVSTITALSLQKST